MAGEHFTAALGDIAKVTIMELTSSFFDLPRIQNNNLETKRFIAHETEPIAHTCHAQALAPAHDNTVERVLGFVERLVTAVISVAVATVVAIFSCMAKQAPVITA